MVFRVIKSIIGTYKTLNIDLFRFICFLFQKLFQHYKEYICIKFYVKPIKKSCFYGCFHLAY